MRGKLPCLSICLPESLPLGCPTFSWSPRERICPPLPRTVLPMAENQSALPGLPCSRLHTASYFCLFALVCSWHLPLNTGPLASLFFFIQQNLVIFVAVPLFLQASHSSSWARGRWLWLGWLIVAKAAKMVVSGGRQFTPGEPLWTTEAGDAHSWQARDGAPPVPVEHARLNGTD